MFKQNFKENIDKISVEENFTNLIYFSGLISELEHFVFFGTLLGLVRENNLIEGDDDIDFYVNAKERNKLIEILRKNNIDVNLDLKVNQNKSFLQIARKINDKNLIADFYFYEDDLDELYIIEKWNFEGGTHIPSKYLRIPKTFVFPIVDKEFNKFKIKFPSSPIYLCEFLYGTSWKVKLKKDKEYVIKVIDGKPVQFIVKKTLFGTKHLIKNI